MNRSSLPLPQINIENQDDPQIERHILPLPQINHEQQPLHSMEDHVRVGDLHLNQERIDTEKDYRIEILNAIAQKSIHSRGFYHIQENLRAVEEMKKMNLWPVLHYSEATEYAEDIARFFNICSSTVRDLIKRNKMTKIGKGQQGSQTEIKTLCLIFNKKQR